MKHDIDWWLGSLSQCVGMGVDESQTGHNLVQVPMLKLEMAKPILEAMLEEYDSDRDFPMIAPITSDRAIDILKGYAAAADYATTAIHLHGTQKDAFCASVRQVLAELAQARAELAKLKTKPAAPNPSHITYPFCNQVLRERGLAYPRTCAMCKLGPCLRKS